MMHKPKRSRLTNNVTVSQRKERSPELSIIFVPRKLGRKSKAAPIYCRLTYDGQRTMFATGVHCALADFDTRSVIINGQPDQTRLLQALKAQAERAYSDLRVTGRKISTAVIRDLALGKTLTFEQVPTLVSSFSRFLDERSKPEVETGDIDRDTHKQHERWANRIAEYFISQYGPTCQLVYIVNRKWTDAGEKRRDSFKHVVVSEKYDFSAVGPSLAA